MGETIVKFPSSDDQLMADLRALPTKKLIEMAFESDHLARVLAERLVERIADLEERMNCLEDASP